MKKASASTSDYTADLRPEAPPFKALFCRRFMCSPADFEKRAFHRCLYAHARFLALFIRVLRPRFFDPDLAFIDYLGTTRSLREVQGAASEFHAKGAFEKGFWGADLRILVSGFKAITLAQQLFSTTEIPDS